MASIGKKLHHYVPRFYLRAWAERDLVYCLRDGKILRTNVRNVAAENYFYRLRELSPTDTTFIRKVAIADSPESLKPYLEYLLSAFSLPQVARRGLEVSGNARAELLAGVGNLITEMNENLHTSIEQDFKPYLDAMLAGDLRFYAEPARVAMFFRGIAAQYLRTNQSKRARLTWAGDMMETFQRAVNVLVHILAIKLAFGLYADRERYRLILLENATDVPFITADQPVINIAARPEEAKPPDKFELYYPLSPSKAMLLVEPLSDHLADSPSVSAMLAHHYNLLMGAHPYQQTFANSRKELESVRTELPAFRS
jgi:hypothetical protein